jgi:hypothetical protein
METAGELAPSSRVLLGPGPSNVHSRVLKAMSTPLVGHLDPEFLRLMEETKALLRSVFQTKNTLTLPISGTGSAGMETCFVNLLEPGDEGSSASMVFGACMDAVERCGQSPRLKRKGTRICAEQYKPCCNSAVVPSLWRLSMPKPRPELGNP